MTARKTGKGVMSPLKGKAGTGAKAPAKAKPLTGKAKGAKPSNDGLKAALAEQGVIAGDDFVEAVAKHPKVKKLAEKRKAAAPAKAPRKSTRKTEDAPAAAPAAPTFEERFCGLAYLLIRAGKTEDDVAEALEVDLPTIALWRIEHWKFDRAFEAYGNSGGRPTLYDDKYAAQAQMLAKLGATDLEVSQFFNVALRTIHRWKIEHPEFGEALQMGKEEADLKVEESLYRRAVGYTFDSEKIVTVDKEIHRVDTIEHVPPDTKAAMFWLQNRRPGIWRDTKHIKHDVEPESAIGTFMRTISGNTLQPKDQDGPASQSRTIMPRQDEQERSDGI